VQLKALTQRTVDWQKLDEWLARTEALVADVEAGQAKLDEEPALIRSQAAEAAEIWKGMTPAERELHTLHSGDGVPF
jgi:hypothetical protein